MKKLNYIAVLTSHLMLACPGTSQAIEKPISDVVLLCEGTISSNVAWKPVIRIMYTAPPPNPAEVLKYIDGKFIKYTDPLDPQKPVINIWIDDIPHYTYSADFIFNGSKSKFNENVEIKDVSIGYISKMTFEENSESFITTFSLNRFSGQYNISKNTLNGKKYSLVSSGSGVCKKITKIF